MLLNLKSYKNGGVYFRNIYCIFQIAEFRNTETQETHVTLNR